MSSKSTRSRISPFRSRKSPSAATAPPKLGARPTTPSSSSSSRPSTPSSASARPTTPSSASGFARSAQPSKLSPVSPPLSSSQLDEKPEFAKSKENVTVTVRFRPLSAREINKGDEVAWYADGDYIVRNEFNPSIAYGFDKVFGPATTTRHVYDVAAQHVVSGAMEGINGTVFAYGVTSSGKTHTMHGEQKSPGIIPLAIKDVFSIIQETPGREFLLRVSYLEIYNEVINDLLDPTSQNLRIREDSQGTYVEGIKEEVVLSPAHALSLIAAGEEHRHVGSNNFNLVSSRSHTIFTLTIESSSSGENEDGEDVRLSQLNLIDLAGSESSKTETTGLRRKEGSYINKSLLTLGTVIAKLTDCKATHIPYRDSKLTRLLQSSLSGHGRISLICTVTPASSNTEETHNTLKFAHRSKHVEIKASQNKILDEKSLIKKYQREISCLKQELQQLKRGMMGNPYFIASNQEDLVNLKLQLEAGQVKLQSRLEEEEEAKAALMGRIQRLTKLILVSTKNCMSSNMSDKVTHRRRHSFGEDELAYLPNRKREYFIDDDDGSIDSEFSAEGRINVASHEDSVGLDKWNRKRGMLGWLKLRKSEQLSGLSPSVDSESSVGGSPSCSQSSQQKQVQSDWKDGRRKSVSRKVDEPSQMVETFAERTQAGELFSATVKGRRPLQTGTTIIDQMDLLREQVKMLAGEVALCTSSLKRLSEQSTSHPEDAQLQEQMQKLKDEINEKKQQMAVLEQRIVGSFDMTQESPSSTEMCQALSTLTSQLSEKTFELEIMSADNRVLQEQLHIKISENTELQETISLLRQQLASLKWSKTEDRKSVTCLAELSAECGELSEGLTSLKEVSAYKNAASNEIGQPCSSGEGSKGCNDESSLMAQVVMQAAEIENLKQEKVKLVEEKEGLEIHRQKLAEEASYAKELAAAAANELRNLAEEVTKLSYQNAILTSEVASSKEIPVLKSSFQSHNQSDGKQNHLKMQTYSSVEKPHVGELVEDLQKKADAKSQREASLEAALTEKGRREAELERKVEEAKRREQQLENELANMWVLVAKIKKNGAVSGVNLSDGLHNDEFLSNNVSFLPSNDHHSKYTRDKFLGNGITDNVNGLEEARSAYEQERRRCKELEGAISRLKGEDLIGLDFRALEELQNFHVEALSKICQEKTTRVL